MRTTSTMLLTALVLTLWFLDVCHCDPAHPEVQLDPAHPEVQLGETVISGLRSTTPGGQLVHKFLGIRYGQAPKGPLRFKPPVQARLPRRVNAQSYGAQCPQGAAMTRGMSEDCLFLNVFVPVTQHHRLVPVLVWIHGGGFIVGGADPYEGEELAGDGGIIVVTLNYRLGALGFLSTGDGSSRGNYGLWDQRLALQWVQEHVEQFGGDKTRVTLAGMSAGAASASLHALSPLSRDLFRQVMILSGAVTAPWARVSSAKALKAAKVLGQRLGCPVDLHNTSTLSLVSCLRDQPVQDILASSVVVFPDQVAFSLVDFVWGPVKDDSLVVDIGSATPFAGPLLAGLVNNEGDILFNWTVPRVSNHIPDAVALLGDRQFFNQQFLPTLLKQAFPAEVPLPWPTRHGRGHKKEAEDDDDDDEDEEHKTCGPPSYQKALQRLRDSYVREEKGRDGGGGAVEGDEVREVYGDQGFVLGVVRFLDQFCDGSDQPCFLYFVDYQTERPGIEGFRHVDDVVFLFGFNTTISRVVSAFDGHVTDLDLQLSRDLRQQFANFVKTGDPNNPGRPQGWPRWTPYTSKGANYLRVSPSPAVLSHFKADKMAVWLDEIPRVLSSAKKVTDDEWLCPDSASSGGTVLLSVSENCVVILLALMLYQFV